MQDLAAAQRRAAPSTDDDPMGAPARRGASIPGLVARAHLGLAHLNGRQVWSARHLPHAPSGRARALPPRPALYFQGPAGLRAQKLVQQLYDVDFALYNYSHADLPL